MNKFQFPHIHRIKPAAFYYLVSIVVWLTIIGVIAGNVIVDLPMKESEKIKETTVESLPEEKRAQESIETWKHIADILPHYQYAYFALVKEYYALEQNDEAKRYMEKAIVLNPVDPTAKIVQDMLE